ncbi:MAG: alpha/beta fold hydrolase [Hyphomicrobiales bacterium]|nr:alpha/beta fold hydrolase [Hyphomicrobiales bacterium]
MLHASATLRAGQFKPKTGHVEALDRIPDTIFALLLPRHALEPAQITSSVREAGSVLGLAREGSLRETIVIYTFGPHRIDTAAFEFWQNETRKKVEPQVLDLLLLLIENRDRIVTKDEIIESVWDGRIVSDAAVSSRIKTARQLIGDTGKNQDFIRTVHGRGFRFVAPVAVESAGDDQAVSAECLTPNPTTLYARSGDVHIAYQLFGDGPVDLVFAPGFISQIDNYWAEPNFNRWLTALGKVARVAMFDKRGTGLSDQVPNLPGMDERMDDVRAVMDAAGFDRAVIMGISEGGSLASLFAASHPQRASGLILYGAFAQFSSWFPNDAALQELFDYAGSAWGTGNSVGYYAPSMVGDDQFRVWWGKFERLGATPGAVVDLMRMNKEIDISQILPAIAVPTLVIHRGHDTLVDVEGGRTLANNIPGARYLELPGRDHIPWVGDSPLEIIQAISDFIASLPETREVERFVATVLVLKYDREPGLLEGPVRLAIARAGGILINQGEESLTARFNGPARALRASMEIIELLGRAGLNVRVGTHTGEVDLVEANAGGMAATIADKLADLAEENQVIASRTVKDLVAGSGIAFASAGTHQLPQFEEAWQSYRVLAPGADAQ